MKKVLLLMLGCALIGGAQASAQQTRVATVHPGYIGIRYEDENIISPTHRTARVTIIDVSKGSPAEKAGVRTGDEIVRINGLSATNGKFAAVARTLTEGDTVKLRIKRDGKEREVTIVAAPRPDVHTSVLGPDRIIVFSTDSVRGLMRQYLDSARVHLDSLRLPRILVRPGDSTIDIRIERYGDLLPHDTLLFQRDSLFFRGVRVRAGADLPPGEIFRHFEEMGPGPIIRSIEVGSRAIAGAEFTDLDPGMKSYFGIERGLLTLRVVPETPAARAGLMVGDVIVKANGTAVTTVADLRRILFAAPETLKLEVLRNRESKTLEVPLQRKRSSEE